MPVKDLGTKHICWKCSTKYYDLRKADPVCPKCGADPRQAPVIKPPSASERRKAAAKVAPIVEVAEVVEEVEIDEELAEDDDDAEEEAGEEEK